MIDFKNVKSKFDLIVTNPPYLSNSQFNKSDPEIKNFEPKIALVGGSDGFKFYKEFAKNIKELMSENSYFLCEIGLNQKTKCISIFENSGLILKNITKDLQGIERILCFSKDIS